MKRPIKWPWAFALAIGICTLCAVFTQEAAQKPASQPALVNSIGATMVRVPAGKFLMGDPNPPEQLTSRDFLLPDDEDERPAHEVSVTEPFYISETAITLTQFQKFRPAYSNLGQTSPYASHVSWNDAVAFAEWLSRKEHRRYRLPTEAEWEYACRAGTTTPFWSGSQPPQPGAANPWGIEDMGNGIPEWTLDWYGRYSDAPESNPSGPAFGFARVIRGNTITKHRKEDIDPPSFYRRCANRASLAADYRGLTAIGFRIVESPAPLSKPAPARVPFFRRFVKPANGVPLKAAPDPSKPWFQQRALLPIPPEDSSPQAIMAAGFSPAIQGHNHSPGLAVCPNGDVLAIFFSSSPVSESLPNTAYIGTRLRFGANQWDAPGLFMKFADANNQSAMLWNDKGTLNFFGGGRGLPGVPFRWTRSNDSGATWSPTVLPKLIGAIGSYAPQPITSAFYGPDGTLYVATDAADAHSLLWASRDGGKTWFDTGGRTGGRHTAFVVLRDGSILGMGGKNSNIGGYMPESISRDGGKSWTITKSPFPALSTNQRPVILRLADGKLFFASDFQNHIGVAPPGVKERGAFVALSSDEGKTWKIKKLATALPHEMHVLPQRPGWPVKDRSGDASLGYATVAQAPNGIIYLISTMNHPAQEFEMNEAWILSDDARPTPMFTGKGKRIFGGESYPNERTKARWSGKIEPDGRYELDGTETWFYASGAKEYRATYKDGSKVGLETRWSSDGRVMWQWNRRADGTSVWVHYWPNGRKRQESHWRNGVASGPATLWNTSGAVIFHCDFQNGFIPR